MRLPYVRAEWRGRESRCLSAGRGHSGRVRNVYTRLSHPESMQVWSKLHTLDRIVRAQTSSSVQFWTVFSGWKCNRFYEGRLRCRQALRMLLQSIVPSKNTTRSFCGFLILSLFLGAGPNQRASGQPDAPDQHLRGQLNAEQVVENLVRMNLERAQALL